MATLQGVPASAVQSTAQWWLVGYTPPKRVEPAALYASTAARPPASPRDVRARTRSHALFRLTVTRCASPARRYVLVLARAHCEPQCVFFARCRRGNVLKHSCQHAECPVRSICAVRL